MRLATPDTPPALDLTPRTHTPQTFCVWQHAVPLLESHTVIFPDETRCFDSLAEMYRLVGGFGGLWVCVCVCLVGRCFDSLAEMYRLVGGLRGPWVDFLG